MDDLNKKISDLLGSPDGMARIQSMMEALGIGGDGGESAPTVPFRRPLPRRHPRRLRRRRHPAAGCRTCRRCSSLRP